MMGGGYEPGADQQQLIENETNFTSEQPERYEEQVDMQDQEIDFDEILGDAIMAQAEYEEDRDD